MEQGATGWRTGAFLGALFNNTYYTVLLDRYTEDILPLTCSVQFLEFLRDIENQ